MNAGNPAGLGHGSNAGTAGAGSSQFHRAPSIERKKRNNKSANVRMPPQEPTDPDQRARQVEYQAGLMVKATIAELGPEWYAANRETARRARG
jgi:hypothetical protein